MQIQSKCVLVVKLQDIGFISPLRKVGSFFAGIKWKSFTDKKSRSYNYSFIYIFFFTTHNLEKNKLLSL